MIGQTRQFYDQFSIDYDLIFGGWDKAVRSQGENLDKLINSLGHNPPETLLDCSCGIGTQAIGLAICNYQVTGTDISPKSISRAKDEAKRFDVSINLHVQDLRELTLLTNGNFDIVISCDSFPHLLTNTDLIKTISAIHFVLKSNGLFLASFRNYESLLKIKPTVFQPIIYGKGAKQWLAFETWNWHKKKPIYELNHFILKKNKDGWQTVCRTANLRAIRQFELTGFLLKAGFSDVKWHQPEDTGFFQPIVTARKS